MMSTITDIFKNNFKNKSLTRFWFVIAVKTKLQGYCLNKNYELGKLNATRK